MANILDYIDWRGDLDIKKAPFNEVDGLVLSLLSYMELSDIAEGETLRGSITLREAVNKCFAKFGDKMPPRGAIIPKEFPTFFRRVADSERYGNMRVLRFKNVFSVVSETQFAALCISVGDGSFFVSYRGTDDSLAGWKEDFNMSFMDSVPAQRIALDYLCDAARVMRGKIRIGGHSKGGNLSMYAAINSPKRILRRILNVYNNDGPGFNRQMTEFEGYSAVKDRMQTALPHYSVVGLLLEHTKVDKVVKSTADGIWQHDPFSWEVKGTHFVTEKKLSNECLAVEKALKSWMSGYDSDERREFVEAVYSVFRANGANSLTDIASDKIDFVRSLAKVDPKVRDVIIESGKLLVREGWNTAQGQWKLRKKSGGDKVK